MATARGEAVGGGGGESLWNAVAACRGPRDFGRDGVNAEVLSLRALSKLDEELCADDEATVKSDEGARIALSLLKRRCQETSHGHKVAKTKLRHTEGEVVEITSIDCLQPEAYNAVRTVGTASAPSTEAREAPPTISSRRKLPHESFMLGRGGGGGGGRMVDTSYTPRGAEGRLRERQEGNVSPSLKCTTTVKFRAAPELRATDCQGIQGAHSNRKRDQSGTEAILRDSDKVNKWARAGGGKKEATLENRNLTPGFTTAASKLGFHPREQRANEAGTNDTGPGLQQPFQPPLRKNREGKPGSSRDHSRKGGGGVPHGGGGGKEGEGTLSSRTKAVLRLDGDAAMPEALAQLDPASIERICNEVVHGDSRVSFDDIAGQETAKQVIHEVVLWPMLNPSIFCGHLKPPRGILLFGPPGTGKTMIGKAIASNMNATFFSISATSLTSKWIGEGEKMVKTLFAIAEHLQPSVIFIDEIDSLLSMRKSDGEHEASRRMKNQFLVEMDGCGHNSANRKVLIVGATNRPEEIDEAARRRMPKQMYIPLPDESARAQFLERNLPPNHNLSDEERRRLVEKTSGYSGSDLMQIIREAAMQPVREIMSTGDTNMITNTKPEDCRPVEKKDLKYALQVGGGGGGRRRGRIRGSQLYDPQVYQPTVSPHEVRRYEEYNRLHGAQTQAQAKPEDIGDDW